MVLGKRDEGVGAAGEISGQIEAQRTAQCAFGEPGNQGALGRFPLAAALGQLLGTPVPMLGQIPIDVRLREGGDSGVPLVLGVPDSPAGLALTKIASELGARARGLAGRSLGLTPA